MLWSLLLTAQAGPTPCVQALYKDLRGFASASTATKVAKMTCADGLDLPTYEKGRAEAKTPLSQQAFDQLVQDAAAAYNPEVSPCEKELALDLQLFAPAKAAQQVATSTCSEPFDLTAYRKVRNTEPGLRLTQVTFDKAVQAGAASPSAAPQEAPHPVGPTVVPKPVDAWDRAKCVELLQPLYQKSWPASYAMDQAHKSCQTAFDFGVFHSFYPKYEKTWPAKHALKLTLEQARKPGLAERIPMIDSMYAILLKTWPSNHALEEAVRMSKGLDKDDQACIDKAYAAHSQQWPANHALEQAVKNCR